MWSIVFHWVHRLWGFLSGAGHGHPPPMFFLGPPCRSCRAICRLLLLVLGVEVPRLS